MRNLGRNLILIALVSAFTPLVSADPTSRDGSRLSRVRQWLASFRDPQAACKAALTNVAPPDFDASPDAKNILTDGQQVRVSGIKVSGKTYTPVDEILKRLDLGEDGTLDRHRHGRILSIAEGYSELLPELLRRGYRAQGVDLWYHRQDIPDNHDGRDMRAFMARYRDHLVQGSAFALPFEDASLDLVLSHNLVNNLWVRLDGQLYEDIEKRKLVIREAVRVLKPGGDARIYAFNVPSQAIYLKYIEEIGQTQIEASFEGHLLKIHKIADDEL